MINVSAQAWFAANEVPIAPGEPTLATLTVVNLGEFTETFAIVPSGLAAGWVTIRPASVTLFGGSQEQVQVEINPPLLPSTTAGATALTMRVIPQGEPDDVASTETTLQIAASYDRRITMLQPAQRARRKAVYEVMIDNHGNTHASCRMRLADHTGRVEADFDPPAIGVEPGASTLVKMKVHSNRLQWERRSRTVQFTVEAEQSGCPTATGTGTFVQAPVVPERFWGRLVSMALLGGALAGVWFGVIRPEIRNVARDEATKAVASAPVASAPVDNGAASSTTTTLPSQPTGQDQLVGVSERLTVQAPIGSTIIDSFTVPEGQTLLLTDVLLQNPYFDGGKVVLLRGTDVLFEWNLDNIQIDAPNAVVSPLELAGGTQLSFSVTCSTVGDPTLGQCQPGLLFSGKLRPN